MVSWLCDDDHAISEGAVSISGPGIAGPAGGISLSRSGFQGDTRNEKVEAGQTGGATRVVARSGSRAGK